MLELARASDRRTVNTLALQVHAMHVAWRLDIYEMVDELYTEERFENAIREKQLFVAKLGEDVVGYVLLKIREYNWPGVARRKVMLVDELCVREDVRGQGIGKQIMCEVRLIADIFGCSDLQLSVCLENDTALVFYQKCGFTVQNINMQMKV